jgi:O-antigen/teichoic acid export membrane protein
MEVQNVTVWSPFTFLIPRLTGHDAKRYTGNTFLHQMIATGLVATALAIVGGVAVIVHGVSSLAMVTLMLSVTCIPFLTREYTRRVCFAKFEMRDVLLIDTVVAIVQLSALFALSKVHPLSPVSVYAIIGGATCLVVTVWLFRSRNAFAPTRSEVKADWQRNWSLGKWFLGGNLSLLAGTQVYPWALSVFHGTSATGALGAGDGIVNLARAGLMAAQNILGPITAHAYARGGATLVRKIVVWTTVFLGLGTALFCLVVFLHGEHLMTLLYGKKFAGLGPLISLMSLNMLCLALTVGPSYALSAMDRPDINFRINLVVLVLSCTVGIWLVKAYGPIGAAMGLVVSNGVATVVRHVVFFHLFGTRRITSEASLVPPSDIVAAGEIA